MKFLSFTVMIMLLGATAFAQDFKKDEVLCRSDEGYFFVGKVLKPASSATNDQLQVLAVADGSTSWIDMIMPSHKAKKEEIVEGAWAIYPQGYADWDSIKADDYRRVNWRVGHITSIQEMFKNFAEIDGGRYNWKLVRIPDDPSVLDTENE